MKARTKTNGKRETEKQSARSLPSKERFITLRQDWSAIALEIERQMKKKFHLYKICPRTEETGENQ